MKKLAETRIRPESSPLYEKGKLVAMVSARDFSTTENVLRGATVVTYDSTGKPAFVLLAKEILYEDHGWHLQGGAALLSADGRTYVRILEDAWPQQVPQLTFTPRDLITRKLIDLDSLSMRQIQDQLKRAKENPHFDPSQKLNLEYGFWNKIALPLSAIIFGLVGAPLGIRSPRSNVSSGFWISVLILFGYIMLTNLMAVNARGGMLSPALASFVPLTVGLICAIIIIYRKNS
jgi:lipopolysaccharide export system permease protein